MDQMIQSSGFGCYACGAQAIGQCKNDGGYYCAKHGARGYCQKCIEQARAYTPGGVSLVVWALYGTAAFIVLTMCFGGLLLGGLIGAPMAAAAENSQTGSLLALVGKSLGLILAIGFVAVYTLVVGVPLFFIGRALNNGATWARTLIVIVSYLLLLLVPVGTLIGSVILYLLNQQPTQAWFEMRSIT